MKNNVIGSGLLARAFLNINYKLKDVVIFASGVSNSSCKIITEFERESLLLDSVIKSHAANKTLIYFSTCSIYDSTQNNSSLYIKHKLLMESRVKEHSKFIIFRLPQVVGLSSNPYTLTNFFSNSILSGNRIEIQRNAFRNIIDIEDLVRIAFYIVSENQYINHTLNIANNKSDKVIDILKIMEGILQKEAYYNLVDGGSSYEIDVNLCCKIAKILDISFDSCYTFRTLNKYYSLKKLI